MRRALLVAFVIAILLSSALPTFAQDVPSVCGPMGVHTIERIVGADPEHQRIINIWQFFVLPEYKNWSVFCVDANTPQVNADYGYRWVGVNNEECQQYALAFAGFIHVEDDVKYVLAPHSFEKCLADADVPFESFRWNGGLWTPNHDQLPTLEQLPAQMQQLALEQYDGDVQRMMLEYYEIGQ
jgi:hypothetical protein